LSFAANWEKPDATFVRLCGGWRKIDHMEDMRMRRSERLDNAFTT
jgi:hypothetical protein